MSKLLHEEGDYKLYNDVLIVGEPGPQQKKYDFLYAREARRFGETSYVIGLGASQEYVRKSNFKEDLDRLFDIKPGLKLGDFEYDGVKLKGEFRDDNYLLRSVDDNYPPGVTKSYKANQNPEYVYRDFIQHLKNLPEPSTISFYVIREPIRLPRWAILQNSEFIIRYRLTDGDFLEYTEFIEMPLATKSYDGTKIGDYTIQDGKIMIAEDKKMDVPADVNLMDEKFMSDTLKAFYNQEKAKWTRELNPRGDKCNLDNMKMLNKSLLTRTNNGLGHGFVQSSTVMGVGLLMIGLIL